MQRQRQTEVSCDPIFLLRPSQAPHWPQLRPGCSPRGAFQPSPWLSLLPAHSSPHSSHHTAFAHDVPTYWNICSALSHLLGLCSPFSSQLSFFQEAFLTSSTMSTPLTHYKNYLGLLSHQQTLLRVTRSSVSTLSSLWQGSLSPQRLAQSRCFINIC